MAQPRERIFLEIRWRHSYTRWQYCSFGGRPPGLLPESKGEAPGTSVSAIAARLSRYLLPGEPQSLRLIHAESGHLLVIKGIFHHTGIFPSIWTSILRFSGFGFSFEMRSCIWSNMPTVVPYLIRICNRSYSSIHWIDLRSSHNRRCLGSMNFILLTVYLLIARSINLIAGFLIIWIYNIYMLIWIQIVVLITVCFSNESFDLFHFLLYFILLLFFILIYY